MMLVKLLSLVLTLNLTALNGPGFLVDQSVYLNLDTYESLSLQAKPKKKPSKTLTNQASSQTRLLSKADKSELLGLFQKYGQQYGVSTQVLSKIAACESGYNTRAVNGPYAGAFQFSAQTWVANRKNMGLDPNPSLRFDARESVKTTAFKIARDGTGAWPVCGT